MDIIKDGSDMSGEYKSCLGCGEITVYKDIVCGDCSLSLPKHIPYEQLQDYIIKLKRIKDAKNSRGPKRIK